MQARQKYGQVDAKCRDGSCSHLFGAPTTLPHPFACDLEAIPSCARGADRRRHWRRNLLAQARRLLVEHDIGGFSLRSLADACGTSSQTIYNNIGAKSDVITAALMDYNQIVLDHSKRVKVGDNPYTSLFLTWRKCAEDYSDYVRMAENVIFSDTEAYKRIYRQAARDMLPFVQSIMDRGAAPPDSIMLICYQLASIANNALREWSQGLCSLDDSYNSAVIGGDLYLTGAFIKYGGQPKIAATRRLGTI